MLKIYRFLCLSGVIFLGCTCDSTMVQPASIEPVRTAELTPLEPLYPSIEFELMSGKVSPNGTIYFNSPDMHPPADGAILNEVIALIDDVQDISPDLLRVQFVGHHVEWIGSSGGGTALFETETECMDSGLYCEPFAVGSGTSGVFDPGINRLIGVQVILCRDTGFKYNIPISAELSYIGDPDPIIVSSTENIVLTCNPTLDSL